MCVVSVWPPLTTTEKVLAHVGVCDLSSVHPPALTGQVVAVIDVNRLGQRVANVTGDRSQAPTTPRTDDLREIAWAAGPAVSRTESADHDAQAGHHP